MKTWWSYFAQSHDASQAQSRTSDPELQDPWPTPHPAPCGTLMAPSTPQGPGSKARAEHGPREGEEGGTVHCRRGAPRVAGTPTLCLGLDPFLAQSTESK